MNILGISAYYHDSAACLLRDGRILCAAQEERLLISNPDSGLQRGGGSQEPRQLRGKRRHWKASSY